MIDGISRLGVLAKNPLYFPGHLESLRYHYFWFLPCALVERAGYSAISARQALIASDVWCGWALMRQPSSWVCASLHPAGWASERWNGRAGKAGRSWCLPSPASISSPT